MTRNHFYYLRRLSLAALAAAAFAGCAGLVRSDSRVLVMDDDGHPIPSAVFQGKILFVNYAGSMPHVMVTDESGAKLSLIVLASTRIELEDIDHLGNNPLDGPTGHTTSMSTHLDWQGNFHSYDPTQSPATKRALFRAAEQGGGHIRGVLGQVPAGAWVNEWGASKGEWYPAQLWIALTHEQAAQFAKAQAASQAQIAAREEQAAEAKASQEAARLQRIAAWRELKVKPPLPEAAHKFRVLAEDALHEKRFADAANYYGQALAIEPLWPQGQFNLALICGELKRYNEAASHMRHYLELEPNAKDARTAGDKIIVWDEKAKLQSGK